VCLSHSFKWPRTVLRRANWLPCEIYYSTSGIIISQSSVASVSGVVVSLIIRPFIANLLPSVSVKEF